MSVPVVPLGELCEMDRRGLRPTDPAGSDLPYVGVEHVGSATGIIDLDDDSRIGIQKSTTFRFDSRHVLYAKLRPYLNKVATPDFSGKCSTELVPLLPKSGTDRSFLAYLLKRPATVEFVMSSVTGSRMPRTDMKALLSLPVPLPSLDDQQQIVDILNRVAKIERLRTQVQERLREFIPALFVKMFGDPVENPMRWEVHPLGDFCVLTQYGTSTKANDRSEGVPVLRMGNITYRGDLDCADLKSVVLSGVDLKKYALRAGDILFNRTNSKELVGKTGIWDGRFEAVAASYFIRLRLDETRVLPTYVWAFMNSAAMKHRLFTAARGAIGQANINAKEVKSLSLPVPPASLQRRYERIVESARAALSVAESGHSVSSALNDSLMFRLLADFL